MKTILSIASIMTWFNLVFWGAAVAFGILGSLVTGQLVGLMLFVLLSSIPLTCFAALKLQTSIRHPDVPLDHQSPVGIRFVGLMALFFGIWLVFGGVNLIADPAPFIDGLKKMAEQFPENVRPYYNVGKVFGELAGVGVLVLGLLVAVNVVLNLRLLRWYYLRIRR